MDKRFNRYYTYIKPVLRNKYVKTYSSVAFTVFTVIIFSVFAIRPTLSTIVSLQKASEEQQVILKQVTDKIEALSQGRKNYQAIPADTKQKMVNLLPDSTQLPSLLNTLTIAAKQHQASISGIQFQPTTLQNQPTKLPKNQSLQEINFTFNVQGDYQQLVNFVTSLNKVERLLIIESVTINKPEEGPLLMSIIGKAYYYQ